MIYDVDYFINKFSSIPEEKWCTDKFTDHDKCYCALGFCGETDRSHTEESEALILLIMNIVPINDGGHPIYQQPTPKQRVLAALNDLKK